MKKGKYLLRAGLALLIISTIAATFSQVIVEDMLGIERTFGEEPLSIKLARYGLGGIVLSLGMILAGAWLRPKKRAR